MDKNIQVERMENEKRTTEAVGVLAVFIASVLGFFLGVFLFDIVPNFFPTQIVSYPARRLADGTLMPLNRTTYKVNPLMQTIIYWMPGIDEMPGKLVDCAVRNRKNWIGYYPDGSGAVGMHKGKIVTGDPNDIYVGRCYWWLLNFGILH
jgi:hypothetical protein